MPELRKPVEQVADTAYEREKSGGIDGIKMKGQLQHHPRDCNHLQSRGRLPHELGRTSR